MAASAQPAHGDGGRRLLTVRKITGRLLEREGYRVVTAKDGVDALEQLLSLRPDVIIADIEMPRMDGFDLTRNIRADLRLKAVPIIMITSAPPRSTSATPRRSASTTTSGKPTTKTAARSDPRFRRTRAFGLRRHRHVAFVRAGRRLGYN